jgi:hypothetical protein
MTASGERRPSERVQWVCRPPWKKRPGLSKGDNDTGPPRGRGTAIVFLTRVTGPQPSTPNPYVLGQWSGTR